MAMTSRSAWRTPASNAAPRSLSITASTPRKVPSASRTTGMPPPPFATTTKPASTSAAMTSASMIASGCGDGTTLRHPRGPRSSNCCPCAIRGSASARDRYLPIGLVGWANAGSSSATRVRVTTAAVRRWTPRCCSAWSRAFIKMKPSVAWVWAPHQSSGTGGTTAAASSFFTRRLPTWGPLPWVITTSSPSATSSATLAMATCAAAIWSWARTWPSGAAIALPPRATSTLVTVTATRPSPSPQPARQHGPNPTSRTALRRHVPYGPFPAGCHSPIDV